MHRSAAMKPFDRPAFDDPQTFQIIGAAFEVHGVFGNGFSEAVNGEAFNIELQRRAIPFVREVKLPLHYKGQLLPVCYRVDFICFDEILVELKSLPLMGEVEFRQVRRYLRASNTVRCC
jgi:GxxExxY protein